MGAMEQRRLSVSVDSSMDGARVEQVLRRCLHVTPRTISRAKFQEGGITVDGQRALSTTVVHAGQTVGLAVGDSEAHLEHGGTVPAAGALDVVYEDEDLLVVDKPAGLCVHPTGAHQTDTLANRVVAHLQERGVQALAHPVHRLDKGTSGLMVFSTNAHAQDLLQRQLHTSGFERCYLALCVGAPPAREGMVDAPIGPDPTAAGSRMVCADGKEARTRYQVLKDVRLSDGQDASLLWLQLETGRTHQVRVHMAHIGCPLLGDTRYGVASNYIARPALHSAELAFTHPVTGQHLIFQSPLPDDMRM